MSRSRRCPLLIGLTLSSIACTDSTEARFVALPDAPGALSYVVRIGSELSARRIDEPVTAPLTPDVDLEVALYQRSLEDLGLSSGPVEGRVDCARSCQTLTPASIYVNLLRETDTAWVPRAELSEGVQDALIPDRDARCSGCPTKELVVLPLPLPRDVTVRFVAPCDGKAYVGLSTGELLRIDGDERVELICMGGPSLGLGDIRDGFCRDDEVWLIGNAGMGEVDLLALEPDRPCRIATSTAPPEIECLEEGASDCLRSAAPSRADESFEVFVASRDGRIYRYDEQGWALLGQMSQAGAADEPQVLRTGPATAFVAVDTAEIGVVEGDRFSVRALPEPLARARAMAQLLDGSVAVLTYADGIFRLDASNRWQIIPLPTQLNGLAIVAHRTGAFYTLDSGAFGYLDPDHGPCPIDPFGFSTERVFHIGSMDQDRVILGDIVTSNTRRDSAVGLVRLGYSTCDAR